MIPVSLVLCVTSDGVHVAPTPLKLVVSLSEEGRVDELKTELKAPLESFFALTLRRPCLPKLRGFVEKVVADLDSFLDLAAFRNADGAELLPFQTLQECGIHAASLLSLVLYADSDDPLDLDSIAYSQLPVSGSTSRRISSEFIPSATFRPATPSGDLPLLGE
ncbi:hypothetical protein HDU99_001464 [Rhizoclosmatium hyalinum]|nr:hypothetical protein HDU99_001464 [Rhizoclosmatium hyalinum]